MKPSTGTLHSRALLSAWKSRDDLETILPFTFFLSLTFLPFFRNLHSKVLNSYQEVNQEIEKLNETA